MSEPKKHSTWAGAFISGLGCGTFIAFLYWLYKVIELFQG